ncbi:hypothetical protein [Neobacillus sp. DY30]|uniref:hypothetical protein n=1 Tax=Neobacillus sp. DY30 TaxID=3047871 RepID=UPI0024C0672D|nr:hypothetical protein [Neobacillus sp. DY30]WHY00303.1 hypothetical protein QNH29_27890 [Neobacillus sp. DY30]
MKSVESTMSQEIGELLQGQTLILCHTYSKSLGKVISTALSWVFAIDNKTVRFAVDCKSKIVEAVQNHSEITLSFVGGESVYSLSGPSKVKVEKTQDLTLKMAIIEIEVEDLRDITFYGAKITQEPKFIKTYKESLIKKLDDEVKETVFSL